MNSTLMLYADEHLAPEPVKIQTRELVGQPMGWSYRLAFGCHFHQRVSNSSPKRTMAGTAEGTA